MSKYVIKTSNAKMPNSCWGKYKRIAIMEMEDWAPFPKMISKRSIGCIRVIKTWEKLNLGKTKNCAYEKALDEAYRYLYEIT